MDKFWKVVIISVVVLVMILTTVTIKRYKFVWSVEVEPVVEGISLTSSKPTLPLHVPDSCFPRVNGSALDRSQFRLLSFVPSVPYEAVTGFLRPFKCAAWPDVAWYETDRWECWRAADVVAFNTVRLRPYMAEGEYWEHHNELAQLLVRLRDQQPGSGTSRLRRPPGQSNQTWVSLSYEAADYSAEWVEEAAGASLFDAVFAIENAGSVRYKFRLRPDPSAPLFHDRPHDVLLLSSNCDTFSKREQLFAEIVRRSPIAGVTVESLGECPPQQQPQQQANVSSAAAPPFNVSERYDPMWRESKQRLLHQFQFELIVQNALCHNYFDEKLMYALEQGAIPVYLGAPNVDDLEPSNRTRSIVRVAEFDTVAELFDYLRQIKESPALQQQYHAWRQEAAGLPSWPRIPIDPEPLQCRMANVLFDRHRHHAQPFHCEGTWDNYIKL